MPKNQTEVENNAAEDIIVNATETAAETTGTAVGQHYETPMGFEDESPEDLIVPRIKVINALSPERKDKIADEGDILNSLTKEKYNGKTFIPVFKFGNNIWWRDRSEGGGMQCIARDGKRGEMNDGTVKMCAACKRCEFDNTKQGRESLPTCTKYINFFGFFEGERMPIILSFAKTNYPEGKKLYSLAKVTMQNMFNHGYKLESKTMAKAGNEWYIIVVTPVGATNEEDRAFAVQLFKSFSGNIQSLNYDVEDSVGSEAAAPAPADVSKTEY